MSALFTAVSGITSYQTRLDVIGNNLANLNTPGFKAGRADFAEMLSQSLRPATAPQDDGRGGVNPMQVGLGVNVADVKTLHTQGVLQITRQPTDLAVQGRGFFLLTDGTNIFYTRAGAFALDADGSLLDPATGYKVVSVEVISPSAGGIGQGIPTVNIPIGSVLPARATTQASLSGNLSAVTAAGGQATATMRVFDSLGIAHDLRLTLTKTATDRTWDWSATLGSTTLGSGTLTFTTAGAYDAASSTAPPLTIPASALGTAADAMNVAMDFSGITQTFGLSFINQSAQDGYSSGNLESFNVGQDGTVTGVYSNGRMQTLAQVALATFRNPSGLVKLAGNLYRDSFNSGLPQVGAPLTGGLGAVVAGALEGSNVDLASTFADMIITQRGFQANARVISAADELLQELLTLRR